MEKKMESENIMGTMPEGRLLIKLALPMIFSVLVSSLYNIVDSVFVGRIGSNALTAISLGAPISSLMVELSFGVAVGVNAMLSRRLGEKNAKAVSRTAGQGFLLMGAVYLVCLAFGLTGVEAFYRIQTSEAEIIALGSQYTRIVTICSFGLLLQTLVERLLSSTGKTKGAMAVLLTGAVTNMILDPILIFGWQSLPAMGMAGAAIATVIGQCAAGAVGLAINLKVNHEIPLRARSFRPDLRTMKEIMTIAVPTTLTYSIGSVLTFGMNQVLVGLSLAAPAVYVIYNRVRSFVALPVWGIRNTIISIIAYVLICQPCLQLIHAAGVLQTCQFLCPLIGCLRKYRIDRNGVFDELLIHTHTPVVDLLIQCVQFPFLFWQGILFQRLSDGALGFHVLRIILPVHRPFFRCVGRQIARSAAIGFGGLAGNGEVADEVFAFLHLLLRRAQGDGGVRQASGQRQVRRHDHGTAPLMRIQPVPQVAR